MTVVARAHRRVWSRRWVVVSTAVVAALVSGVLLARSEGYLGGRDDDGPLSTGPGVSSGGWAPPGERVVFGAGVLVSDHESRPIILESADVNRATPGLFTEIAYYAGSKQKLAYVRGPLPPGSRPIAEGRLVPGLPGVDSGGDIRVEAAAPLPGVYRWDGLRLRYRRGHRRFEQIVGYPVVLCVHRQRKCPAGTP